MPTPRFEIKDSCHPTWRGKRYSTLERARKDLAHAFPPGRFYVYDRETKERVGYDQ